MTCNNCKHCKINNDNYLCDHPKFYLVIIPNNVANDQNADCEFFKQGKDEK